MPNDEHTHCAELPKLVDDGTNNNYCKWKTKSYHKLHEWDLLKYIEGPESDPPAIPVLCLPTLYHGLNENNQISTVRDPRNADERQMALADAKPWLAGNNITLSCIIASISGQQLHLVQQVKYTK